MFLLPILPLILRLIYTHIYDILIIACAINKNNEVKNIDGSEKVTIRSEVVKTIESFANIRKGEVH